MTKRTRAMFEAIADRLGEHPSARNYEIADSGEYETKLTGTLDVETLAEWIFPAQLTRRAPDHQAEAPSADECDSERPGYRSLCRIGGCVMRAGVCMNCGARFPRPQHPEP